MKIKRKTRSLHPATMVLPVLLLVLLTSLVSPVPNNRIPELVESFYRKYPQQKVFISMDKPSYRAGESVWLKAYVLDATTSMPSGLSKNLVIEVNNSFGVNILTQLCKIEGGYANGDFDLPDTIAEGEYQIRAYTNWMRNFGRDFFFARQFNIWNPEHAPMIFRNDMIANRRLKKESMKKAMQTDLQFLPEGGDLVAGLPSRVGFKAVNELGLGVSVRGDILDKKKNRVTGFSSEYLGMGTFEITPEEGMKYFAEVRSEDSKLHKYRLPEVLPEGFVMRIDNLREDEILVDIKSTYESASVFLVGHVRGEVCHSEELAVRSGRASTSIDKSRIPTGVVHFTLFDRESVPRCERLVFAGHLNRLNIDLDTDKKQYGLREKVEVGIRITDKDNNPVRGNFNLSVAEDGLANESEEFQSNIVSNVWLASDLAGPVEQPDRYFAEESGQNLLHLDYLLMTQGWRRFAWEDVIETNSMDIAYPIERGLSINGRITREFLDIRVRDVPVTLTVLSEFNDVYITRTNSRGEFEFELPDYEDTVNIEITARLPNGRKNLLIYIDRATRPETRKIFSSYTKDMVIQGSKIYRPSGEPEEDTNQVQLTGLYHRPDYLIKVDENMVNYNSVLEIIQGRVPGVMVTGNSVQIRGPSSFLLSSEPLYLIDNVPTDVTVVQSLNPLDVDRIEILKGPSSAIYGSRGANGVISVYTRRGRFIRKGVLEINMFGYHRPREFYSPVYGSEFDHLIWDNRTTLFWEPYVTTDEDGKASVSFYNADRTGTYRIKVEGISSDGIPVYSEMKYQVQ